MIIALLEGAVIIQSILSMYAWESLQITTMQRSPLGAINKALTIHGGGTVKQYGLQ